MREINSSWKAADSFLQGDNYIYGAGRRAKNVREIFPQKKWKGIIDKYKDGILDGIPILPLESYKAKSSDRIIIATKTDNTKIIGDLLGAGAKESQIIDFEHIRTESRENIYYEERCIEGARNCDGVFLDIGCYDGENTIKAFEKLQGIDIAYLYEPDTKNYELCKHKISNFNKKTVLSNIAISDSKGTIKFTEAGVASCFDNSGNKEVMTDTIDNLFRDIRVGFIKMDVEGAEDLALNGARSVISRDKPTLAVSIYHNRDDIISIPNIITSINPDYVFRFGHHSLEWDDTVLYAIDRGRLSGLQ